MRAITRCFRVAFGSASSSQSLLQLLEKGKEAAAAARPLSNVVKGLRNAYESRKKLQESESALSLLEEIANAIEPIKLLSKYAASEVADVFEKIRAKTVENWKKLYPESGSGLKPFSLSMGKGRDRSIEALLSKESYFVQGQHFANAGLQRAIALSFYFALLDHHPGGLGFVVLDDPILSLDEDHRESWSRPLLQPAMESLQIIVGTHQRQYLNDCKHHFGSGRVVELNPRAFTDRTTWRPGDRLSRAEVELERAWTNAPTEMRKWREEVLVTLDSYSPHPIR